MAPAEEWLREGDGVDRPYRRTPAARRAAKQWARHSADRAIVKLSEELARVRGAHGHLVHCVAAIFDNPELADRVLALVPHLLSLLRGEVPLLSDVRMRNVALHADAGGASVAFASDKQAKGFQKGPRLESRGRPQRQKGGCAILPRPFELNPWNVRSSQAHTQVRRWKITYARYEMIRGKLYHMKL